MSRRTSTSAISIARSLGREAGRLRFQVPVTHVYNPLAPKNKGNIGVLPLAAGKECEALKDELWQRSHDGHHQTPRAR